MWNALPENIVAATSLAMFKARLSDFDLARFTAVFQLGFIVLSYLYVFLLFFLFLLGFM